MKRIFSMIAAPIMAFFAGANAATPAESVTAEPTAVVQEATPEQAPRELTGERGVDEQDHGLSGKVTAIDGSTVTVVLAEQPELPADGAQPDDDKQPPEGEAPAKPEDGQQPPEKPADGEAAPEKPADDAQPEKPEGMPELTFSDETVTYDLSNAVVTVEDNGTVSSGDLTDITVDSVLLLKVDENGTVTEVTVLVQG